MFKFKEEKIYFKTSDGLRLCGILSTFIKSTNKCIIFCHGITVDKEEDGIFTNLAKKLAQVGFNVFRFDFRGHGESEGKSVDMTITGEVKDLMSAVLLLQRKGYKDFGILGASFAGGAVSLFCSKHENLVKALVFWNALIDYDSKLNPVTEWAKKYWGRPAFDRVKKFGFTEIGSSKFRVGKNLMNEMKRLKPWEAIQKTKIPMFFVHGTDDTYISVNDSIKYSALMKNAKLEIIEGAEHGFHDNPKDSEKAGRATVKFFQKNL